MSKRGTFWEISVSTTSEAEDAIGELLQDFFGQPASSYTDIETGKVTVATYLPGSGHQEGGALKQAIEGIKRCELEVGSGRISVRKIRREDWAESWKRHFKPIEVGKELLIKPSWSKRRPRKGQAVVVLDPGLSFGTGQHPTTGFCLEQIVARRFAFRVSSFESKRRWFRHNQKPETQNWKPAFLDIGTGSGILAIAAAKLGYAPVDAFDFDAEAVRIARQNARKNRVSSGLKITRANITKVPIRSARKYDLICANLISTLLVVERRRILARLKEKGILVLAGILKSEFSIVQKAYEAVGLKLIASRTEKEWRSGAFARVQRGSADQWRRVGVL